jgi:hypothetical protein
MIGSLVNSVISNGSPAEIKVGMPATVCMWSDRSPAEIAEVVLFKSGAKKGQIRGVKVRPMGYEIVSGSEFDGSARYRYFPLPDAPAGRIYLRDERGRFQQANGGNKLAIGSAEKYHDPSF